MADSQAYTVLGDSYYEDPSQLSQALRQRAGSDGAFHFTPSTASHRSVLVPPIVFTIPQPPTEASSVLHLQHPAVPPPDRAHLLRRAATSKHVPPALDQHHSAPASIGFVERIQGALKMHHTFNGLDAPGDTQPDSQMHKQYTSGIYSSAVEANPVARLAKSLFVEHVEQDDPPTDELDGVGSSQESEMHTVTSPTIVDFDEHALFANNSLAPTSPLKFETPALAGRKRDHSGNMLSSAMRTNTTPGTVASISAFDVGFGGLNGAGIGGGPQISLTQAFNNTQAPTSPIADPINEDVVFQRPSPNFSHARHSSPIPAYSSPIKSQRPGTPRSDPVVRSSSEPQSEYVTLKESQDKRKVPLQDAHTKDVDEDDSWNDLARQNRARRKKEEFHRHAAKSLSHVSAPTTTSPRARRKRLQDTSYPSPDKSRASRSIDHVDDAQANGNEPDYEQESAARKMPVFTDINVTTPILAHVATKHSRSDNKVQVPKTSSHPYQTPSGHTSRNSSQIASPFSQVRGESQTRTSGSQSLLRGALRPHSSKDSVAVMDSQPDVFAECDSILPPKSLRFPSSPSTNQYSINQTTVLQAKTGYTSQVISSSMPPMPPDSSAEEADIATDDEADITPAEERVPSSPPVLTHDEDEDTGERIYDEYAEEILDQDNPLSLIHIAEAAWGATEDLRVLEEELGDGEEGHPDAKGSDHDDLDLVQPQKIDLQRDEEVPETMEQDHDDGPMDTSDHDAKVSHHVTSLLEPMGYPRIPRQDTVPDTDALEETQPSFFPDQQQVDQTGHGIETTNQVRTARENLTGSQRHLDVPHSSRTDESEAITTVQRIQSMNDIFNLPNTQKSAAEEEIEMPQLSGLNEEEGSMSPLPPSPKRRKLTYAAKRNVRASKKSSGSSEPLSDPPLSLISQNSRSQPDQTAVGFMQRGGNEAAAATTRKREEAQAPYKAMATLKVRAGGRLVKRQGKKKGALKSVSKELLQSLSSPAQSPSRTKAATTNRQLTPTTPTRTVPNIDMSKDMTEISGAEEHSSKTPVPLSQHFQVEGGVARAPPQNVEQTGEMLVPNRVFASWPGSHYYPATCISSTSSSHQLHVRFDDGNATMLDAVHVRALDLRNGDHVKVDEAGMKKNTYVVVGFKDRLQSPDSEEFPLTDRFGYASIVLEEKRRDSLPPAKAMEPIQHLSVPMGSVYLTAGLWARLRDRVFKFTPPLSPAKTTSQVGTPVTESITTPCFSRRGTAIPSLLKEATTRATSVASTTRSGSGVFSNMAFVLTSTTADVDKDAVARTLKANGGIVLEQGFHELFDHEASETSSSQGLRPSASPSGNSNSLILKDAYKELGFVALISDAHSRSTKYIQALALNVPCLHLRWIQDSISASRARPFMRYLLPAGVSKFLDPFGVVRSRTMRSYDPAADETSASQMVKERDLLLRKQTVLLVTGKSKKEIERRQPFVFLTHALGAANVGRCADLSAASEILADGHHWDWVYVDNSETSIGDAAAELFGIEKPDSTAKSKKTKKRKRDETEAAEELIVPVELGGRKIRVTCSEFVIQSLILGALIDE